MPSAPGDAQHHPDRKEHSPDCNLQGHVYPEQPVYGSQCRLHVDVIIVIVCKSRSRKYAEQNQPSDG
jgi:hypothetical protein